MTVSLIDIELLDMEPEAVKDSEHFTVATASERTSFESLPQPESPDSTGSPGKDGKSPRRCLRKKGSSRRQTAESSKSPSRRRRAKSSSKRGERTATQNRASNSTSMSPKAVSSPKVVESPMKQYRSASRDRARRNYSRKEEPQNTTPPPPPPPPTEDEAYAMLKAASDHRRRGRSRDKPKKNKSDIAQSYVDAKDKSNMFQETTLSLSGGSSHSGSGSSMTPRRRMRKGMSVFESVTTKISSNTVEGHRTRSSSVGRKMNTEKPPKSFSHLAPPKKPEGAPKSFAHLAPPKKTAGPPLSFKHLAPSGGLKRAVTAGAVLGGTFIALPDPQGSHPLASNGPRRRRQRSIDFTVPSLGKLPESKSATPMKVRSQSSANSSMEQLPSFSDLKPKAKSGSLRRAVSAGVTSTPGVLNVPSKSIGIQMADIAMSSMEKLPEYPSGLQRAVSVGGHKRGGLRRSEEKNESKKSFPMAPPKSFAHLAPKASSSRPMVKRLEEPLQSNVGASKSMHARSTFSHSSSESNLSSSNHSSGSTVPKLRSSSRDLRVDRSPTRAASMPELPEVEVIPTPRRGRRKHARAERAKSMDLVPTLHQGTPVEQRRNNSSHHRTGLSKGSSHRRMMNNDSGHTALINSNHTSGSKDAYARAENKVATLEIPVISTKQLQDSCSSFGGDDGDETFRRMSFDTVSEWGDAAAEAAADLADDIDDDSAFNISNALAFSKPDAVQARLDALVSPRKTKQSIPKTVIM